MLADGLTDAVACPLEPDAVGRTEVGDRLGGGDDSGNRAGNIACVLHIHEYRIGGGMPANHPADIDVVTKGHPTVAFHVDRQLRRCSVGAPGRA